MLHISFTWDFIFTITEMMYCVLHSSFAVILPSLTLLWWQGAAADSEAKSEELSGAVEELHKLLKDAGEGARQ